MKARRTQIFKDSWAHRGGITATYGYPSDYTMLPGEEQAINHALDEKTTVDSMTWFWQMVAAQIKDGYQ